MNKQELLQAINFGKRTAEDEVDELGAYFVETDQWKKIYAGEIDIVYGAKGAGKSAIYSLLQKREQEFAARRILVIAAENPRGTPVFRNLVNKPDIEEQEIYNLWKLYFLSLIAGRMVKAKEEKQIKKVVITLEQAGLLPKEETPLSKIFSSALEYVRRLFRWDAIELSVDPATGTPSGKIVFREPDTTQQAQGLISTDNLLEITNTALKNSKLNVWDGIEPDPYTPNSMRFSPNMLY